jgi:PKD repeat protein
MQLRRYKIGAFVLAIFLIISVGFCGCLKKENSSILALFSYFPENPTTNDIIQFIDESVDNNGSIASWEWDFDIADEYTTETSTLQNPTYRYGYGHGKTFTVKLTVTDTKGNSYSVSKNITVVNQTHLPEENDIVLEISSYERKDHNLDGSKFPHFECAWVELKMTNNWDKEIYPKICCGNNASWDKHFFIYANNASHPYYLCSGISPENTPEKLLSGESTTWTVTFWIPASAEEYKIKYAYFYDVSIDLKEKAFWVFL